ncbi:hypothetical protein swp_2995 [Shewanella piezotolerans WP3]|uniref:Uncharacterized protein n=1 Tax=Shewanella piezotolerans (strain WP3 / JCM 13877) TaxID=225849 RepID=B8CR42_SHEPW|nr:hypothetical protein [Shewanella piezotolerans]ACJ29714.1 hypothetical protein swp_2995 [Shewanella piezotolerans WP3]
MRKLNPRTFTLKSAALLLVAITSLSANAASIDNDKGDIKIFNKEMNQLEQVEINDNIYIATVSDSFNDITEETDYMSEYTIIKRVTDKEAVELDLHEAKSYYIYSINGLKDLTDNVEKHLNNNHPAYFSTTLLKGDKYYHGFSEYIAKVTEYSL